jgi:hypothetical protein
LLGLCAAPRKEDNISPAQAVFGTLIVLPGHFLDSSTNVNELEFLIKFSNESGAAESVATRHNSAQARDMPDELPANMLHAPAVLVHLDGHMPPLEPLYNGPYHVLARIRDWFRIQVSDRNDTIFTSHLKPCLDPSAPTAEPRRQGRPSGPPTMVTFRWLPVDPPPRHTWLCLRLLHYHRAYLSRCLRQPL